MNFEKTKSMVLALLVSLSLILTWSLWTFQPQYDFMPNTKYIQNVTIGEKRQFNELIKPTQFIYHQDGIDYGLTDYLTNNDLYKSIMDLNVSEYEQLNVSSQEELQSLLSRDGSLEMIFPVYIPINIINFIMGPIRQEWDITFFDRIVINFGKDPSFYVVSTKNNQLIKMKIEDPSFNDMKQRFIQKDLSYPMYFSLNVGDGNILYLPENQVKVNELTFSTQNISSTEFKNALFNDPSRVKQYSLENGEESYTDGSRALEISQNKNTMRLINPANQQEYNMEPVELILKSIEFINDHSGWTDSFSLMDWNQKKQSVMFRLMIQGYPVFYANGITSIYQTWRNNEIYEYQRSLTNLRFSIESERKEVVLPSGRELLSYLSEVKSDYNSNLLETATIGFDFSKETSNITLITAKPKWFIKYDGEWEAITIPRVVMDQGGSNFGLE